MPGIDPASFQQFLTFAALVGLVVLYTAVFDIIDLHPQIGSFQFLFTVTYGFYLLFRTVLGVLASLALTAVVDPDPGVALLAFIGTLGSVTVLQNFALNVGGTDVANLAGLRDKYKVRMVEEESERRALRERARALRLQQRLSAIPASQLEMELRRMFLSVGYQPSQASEQIAVLREAAAGDDGTWRIILASNIATINPDYAEQLIATQARPATPALPAAGGTTGP
jgi:hypothetical protein